MRKQLDKFSANRKNGPIELKSKKDSSFVSVKDTDETIKEAFDRKKKKFEEQFEKDLQDEASDLIKDRAAALKRYKDKGGKMSQSKWEIKYNTLYKNRKIGKIGEDTFKDFMDGYKPPKSYKSTGGKDRYIDNFKPNTKTAREIKTGKVNDTKSIRAQIEKDLDILANKDITEIQKIEWHFLDGLDPKLEDRLIEIKRIIGNDKFDYIDYTKNK